MNPFRDLIKLSIRNNGKIPKSIDEHYIIWCYAYHREGKVNPMHGHHYLRPMVIKLGQN